MQMTLQLFLMEVETPAGNIECAGDLWLIIWVEGEHRENKDHVDR